MGENSYKLWVGSRTYTHTQTLKAVGQGELRLQSILCGPCPSWGLKGPLGHAWGSLMCWASLVPLPLPPPLLAPPPLLSSVAHL